MDDERQQVYGGGEKVNATQGTPNLVCTVQYTEVPLLGSYWQQLICSHVLYASEVSDLLDYEFMI